jgi:acetyl-CoA carboxylase biotin carboxyl carrier protein
MTNPKAPADPVDARPIDTRLVRKLADILKDTDLSEIEVERGDLKIRVARSLAAPAAVYAAPPPMALAHAAPAPVAAAPAAAPAAPTGETLNGEVVKSPMVGTAYLQPSPGAEPFAREGDKVEAGQTLLLIEAMKTMNPITAPRSGRLVKLYVGDAQPVEFGEPLAVIE